VRPYRRTVPGRLLDDDTQRRGYGRGHVPAQGGGAQAKPVAQGLTLVHFSAQPKHYLWATSVPFPA
jgi:hypothetical protein